MRIQISGKHIDTGEALQTHVETRVLDVVSKYAGRPTDAHVVFSKDGHEYVAEGSVHLSTGMQVQAKGRAGEVYDAFDAAAEKMEKQLRRYKRRLKNHHQSRENPIASSDAPTYILDGRTTHTEESEPESLQPLIVAETQTKVPSLSVGEAVMQMELAGAPLLVFRNDAHGGVNVVYQREDGNIGWVDPRNQRPA